MRQGHAPPCERHGDPSASHGFPMPLAAMPESIEGEAHRVRPVTPTRIPQPHPSRARRRPSGPMHPEPGALRCVVARGSPPRALPHKRPGTETVDRYLALRDPCRGCPSLQNAREALRGQASGHFETRAVDNYEERPLHRGERGRAEELDDVLRLVHAKALDPCPGPRPPVDNEAVFNFGKVA